MGGGWGRGGHWHSSCPTKGRVLSGAAGSEAQSCHTAGAVAAGAGRCPEAACSGQHHTQSPEALQALTWGTNQQAEEHSGLGQPPCCSGSFFLSPSSVAVDIFHSPVASSSQQSSWSLPGCSGFLQVLAAAVAVCSKENQLQSMSWAEMGWDGMGWGSSSHSQRSAHFSLQSTGQERLRVLGTAQQPAVQKRHTAVIQTCV